MNTNSVLVICNLHTSPEAQFKFDKRTIVVACTITLIHIITENISDVILQVE